LKIDITSIVKNSGGTIQISEKESIEILGTGLGTVTFKGPVEFNGSVTNFNGMLLLEGVARLNYTTTCDRCGEDIEKEHVARIDEEIIERSRTVDEAEENLEDDRFAYSGNVLELDRILADSLITSIPMSHLCQDDCPGLCPLCGAKMKGESCDCSKQDPVDPRFEALKGFFD